MAHPSHPGTFAAPGTITSRMQGDAHHTSDAELMRRTAGGEREAFAEIYTRHNAMVYRFGRLMTGCTGMADDIVQDVFLALMRDAHRYDPTRAALPTYLYAIARHQARRAMLRARRAVAIDVDLEHDLETLSASGDVLGDMVRRQALGRMRAAILTLPSRYREAVVLCDVQGLSYDDAAIAMGCAVGTVRSRLHRARQMLVERMQRREHAETQGRLTTERCPV